LSVSVVLLVFTTGTSHAAEWLVQPSVALRETYTDNLFLQPDALAQSDWVTQVIPEIAVSARGTGLKFTADFAPEITFYSQDLIDDEIYHRGHIYGTAEIAEKLLFIDAGANVDQYDVSVQGPIAGNSNINITGNRASVETFFASPYLVHQFGSSALAEARYTYSVWHSSDRPTFNNDTNTIDLKLANGSSFGRFSWGLDYTSSKIDYDNQPDFDARTGLATAGWSLIPSTRVFAQAGDENYQQTGPGGTAGQEDGGFRWAVGAKWAPSQRTNLTVSGGERFFGNTYFLELSHRTRLLVLRAGYNEDVTTSSTDFFGPGGAGTAEYLSSLYSSLIQDPVELQREVDTVIAQRQLPAGLRGPINFFSADPFLQKRFQASVAMQGVRNIIIATAYTESRQRLTGFNYQTGDLDNNTEINQAGGDLAWNLRVSARTIWNVNAGVQRLKYFPSGRQDDITNLEVGVTRWFEPKFSGSLAYQWSSDDSNDPAAGYTENQVIAQLLYRF
jgi:uncharacterized protein (PEP-CTERM system associated)